jgi:hypothetical protein
MFIGVATEDREYFVTQSEYLGLELPCVQKGDVVVIFGGAMSPFIPAKLGPEE